MEITKIVWKQPGNRLKCMGCRDPAENEVSFSGEYSTWEAVFCPACSTLPEDELLKIVKGETDETQRKPNEGKYLVENTQETKKTTDS